MDEKLQSLDEYWSMNEGAFACLHDKKRTTAFRKALRNSINKGDVVLEMGAGTGVLSMFAVDAGASKVYAVEIDKGNILSLQKVINENGYSDKITVVQGDATTIHIPEQVDYIICEMVATGLVEELQVPAMNNALSFLKKSGQVLLAKYEIFIELVNSKADFYNKTFNIVRFELPEMRDMRSDSLTRKTLFKTIDLTSQNKQLNLKRIFEIPVVKTGSINGIRVSGRTTFADGSTFDNSTSYDFPMILPVETLEVKKGDSVKLLLSYTLSGGPQTLRYKIQKI